MPGRREEIEACTSHLRDAVANLEGEIRAGGATDVRYYRLREIAYAGLDLVELLDGVTPDAVVSSLQSLVNAHVYAFMRSPPTRPIEEGRAAATQLIEVAVAQLAAVEASIDPVR